MDAFRQAIRGRDIPGYLKTKRTPVFKLKYGFLTDGHRRGFTINNGGAAALV